MLYRLAMAAVVVLATAGGATAQVPPQAQPMPAQIQAAREAGGRMRSTGGSLFQASMSGRTAPPGERQDLQQVSFFAVPEPKPRLLQKHDLVTIIVREQSEFTSKATTETKKDAALNAAVTDFIRLSLSDMAIKNDAIANGPLRIRANGEREFNGEGSADRTDSFTARIGAEVVDVKPNGNVVLEARKRIQTDEEVQEFLLSGTARAEDVGIDNTILSTQLADFDLKKVTRGAVRDANKRGAATRFLDWLNPF